MRRLARLLALLSFAAVSGCGSTHYFLTPAQLQEFMAAGPVVPELDREALIRAVPAPGPYRVGPGDLLEVRGPRLLFTRTAEPGNAPGENFLLARVDAEGSIEVPLAGTTPAGGKTLLEIETSIAGAVYPKYLLTKPSIVVRIAEYEKTRVTVLGAVEQPGIHELPRDHLTLFGALTAAGGIAKSANLVVGARLIRVRKAGVTRGIL